MINHNETDIEFEPERLNVNEQGQNLKWCPFGEMSAHEMTTRGTFKGNSPRGLVVHYSAGRSLRGDKDSENCIAYGKKQGYAYWCLSRDGSIFMSHPLNKWGWHAGKSEWKGKSGVGQYCLGLEINNAGIVKPKGDDYVTYYGEIIKKEDVRVITKNKDNVRKAAYHKYTLQQEHSLIELCLWLKSNNPDVFDFDWVVGHDEIAVPLGRKSDPGGSLSMTMPELREKLKALWEERSNQ